MLDHTSITPNIWVINEVFGAADEEFAVSGNFFANAASRLLTGR
jgi:hypothetical protein